MLMIEQRTFKLVVNNFFKLPRLFKFKPGLRSWSRRFWEGVGLLRVLGVGVGIFYPTPTPDVRFLYILVMLTAQLTQPCVTVQCSNFLREPCRVSRDTACNS